MVVQPQLSYCVCVFPVISKFQTRFLSTFFVQRCRCILVYQYIVFFAARTTCFELVFRYSEPTL